MVTLSECTRTNSCYECDNSKCLLQGKKESDCPKYKCDRPDGLKYECERCSFIDKYIESMRGGKH